MIENGINDLPWIQREKQVRAITFPIMKQMEIDGKWELVRPPTLEEDKSGIDYFVKIKNLAGISLKKEIPIQFKIRSKPKYQDIIVSRYQPCYGLDQEVLTKSQNGLKEQSADGRDWRSLINDVTKLYFIATMNEKREYDQVSFILSHKLKEHSINLDNDWENCLEEGKIKPKKYFTKERVKNILTSNRIKDRFLVYYKNPGDEVWYQKNKDESPKFLMYIHSSRRAGFIKIDPAKLNITKQTLSSKT